MAKSKPRVPLLSFPNGVVIGTNDCVYLTYVCRDQRPRRLRAFVIADKMQLCLQVDATSEVPLPENNSPIRVTWPITETHDGYTFPTRLVGIVQPQAAGSLVSLIIETPLPKDVRKMDNRRREIRLPAHWESTIKWTGSGREYEIGGTVHNISFGGCSVFIPTSAIKQLVTFEALYSFFLSDCFKISMRPAHALINATDQDDPAVIFEPFANIEVLIRGRTKTVHDGEEVEVISFELVHERGKLNQLVTRMQVPKHPR